MVLHENRAVAKIRLEQLDDLRRGVRFGGPQVDPNPELTSAASGLGPLAITRAAASRSRSGSSSCISATTSKRRVTPTPVWKTASSAGSTTRRLSVSRSGSRSRTASSRRMEATTTLPPRRTISSASTSAWRVCRIPTVTPRRPPGCSRRLCSTRVNAEAAGSAAHGVRRPAARAARRRRPLPGPRSPRPPAPRQSSSTTPGPCRRRRLRRRAGRPADSARSHPPQRGPACRSGPQGAGALPEAVRRRPRKRPVLPGRSRADARRRGFLRAGPPGRRRAPVRSDQCRARSPPVLAADRRPWAAAGRAGSAPRQAGRRHRAG